MIINCELTNEVIFALQAQNIDCYIVGGFVRDTLLNVEAKDIDIELHHTDLETAYKIISEITPAKIVGNFGVISLEEVNTEFAIARNEQKTGDLHNEFEVQFITNGDLRAAALRRDFTINSMMYDLQNNQLLDFFNGLDDLKSKKIQHVSPAFSEDPLRILRAIKLISKYDFEISNKTDLLCQKLSLELRFLSKSRIESELNQIFKGQYQRAALTKLTQYLNIIFNQKLKLANYSDDSKYNQIQFFKQFNNYKQVIDFCYEKKNTKNELIFVIENYNSLIDFESLDKEQKYMLLTKGVQFDKTIILINPKLEKFFTRFDYLKQKYNGKYFMQIGFSGKEIAFAQKSKIMEELDG